MTAGETILKFTDYPFAYSIMGIIFTALGYGINQNHFLFLGIAGAIGTLFALTDPLGYVIRQRAKEIINEKYSKQNSDYGLTEKDHMISAIKSRAISIEIDKIIGLFYFIIIIIIFILAIMSPIFVKNLVIRDAENNIILGDYIIKILSLIGSGIALTVLSIRANTFWKELDDKIKTAGFHQKAISNEFVTENSIENMTRAVELNDWETARLWIKKIQDEIKYKKGKRELIIKSTDLLFSPLHREAIMSENNIRGMIYSRNYPSFDTGEWNKIKQNSYQSLIEDIELRRRIDSFYNLVQEYNNKIGLINKLTNEIIIAKASEIYSKNVNGISYDIDSTQGNGRVDLVNCALQTIHPLDYYRVKGTLRYIDVQFVDNIGQQSTRYTDNALFDKMWDLVIKDINQNDEIIKFKQMFEQLKIENSELMKIYSEKIEMQWKV